MKKPVTRSLLSTVTWLLLLVPGAWAQTDAPQTAAPPAEVPQVEVPPTALPPGNETLPEPPEINSILLWRSIPFPLPVSAVAFSRDEKTFVAASDNKAYIYNDTLEIQATLRGHRGGITALAVTPDGKAVVTGGEDATIRLWKVSDGSALKTLTGHVGPIRTFAFSPDGKLMASGSHDTAIGVWDLEKQELVKALKGSFVGPTALVFTPDGKTLKSAGYGLANRQAITEFRVWDLASGQAGLQLVQPLESTTVAFSSDGSLLVRAAKSHSMEVHDGTTGVALRTLRLTPRNLKKGGDDWELVYRENLGAMNIVTPLTFAPNAPLVVNVAYGVLRIWDARNSDYLHRFRFQPSDIIIVSPSGRMVASAGETQLEDADGFMRRTQALHLWRVQ